MAQDAEARGAETGTSAEAKFYKAHYLDSEVRDLDGAIALYREVVEAQGVPDGISQEARRRLAVCIEERRAGDLVRLLPAEALAFLEVSAPGKHLADLIEAAGLREIEVRRGGERITVPVLTPALRRALERVAGAAVAITDFDTRRGNLSGVAVVNLGRDDLVRAAVESALSGAVVAGELGPGEPVHGHPSYVLPFASIVLTERLLVAAMPPGLAAETVARLAEDEPDGLSRIEAMDEVGAKREGAALFALVDLRRLLDKAKGELGRGGRMPQEYLMAQAVTDIESLRWAAFRVGGSEVGIAAEAWIRLAEENRALAYHLFRTPPLSRESLAAVPEGVAAFLALGLGEAKAGSAGDSSPLPAITGLDLGREVFANVKDVLAFLLPDPPAVVQTSPHGSTVIPHLGLVFTVRDPARSRALWDTILGIGALVSGASPQPVRKEDVAGREVQVYAFPESIEVCLASASDRVILGTSKAAVARALEAGQGGRSVLTDPHFARGASVLGATTSKILAVHAGRMFDIARPMAGIPEGEAATISAALGDMILAFVTEETPSALTVRVASGIPNLAALAPMLGLGGGGFPAGGVSGGRPSGGGFAGGMPPGGPPQSSQSPRSAVAVRPVAVQAAAVRPVAVRPEGMRAEAVRPEAVRAEVVRSEAVRSEAVRSEGRVSAPPRPGFVVGEGATIGPVTAPDVSPPLPVTPPWAPRRTKVLVAKGSTWRYSDSGSDLGTAWRDPAYDDASWKSGPSPLGYGEDGLGTTVDCGDPEAKRPTTYFRRTFHVERPEDLAELRILLRRDDGAAVYLNGKEVARDNLAPGAGTDAFSIEIVAGAWEGAFAPHPVKPEALRSGDNTIAVEVHQCNGGSSDLVFDLALEGLTKAP